MDKEDSAAESNDSESEDSGVPATDQDKALAEKEKVWLHPLVLKSDSATPNLTDMQKYEFPRKCCHFKILLIIIMTQGPPLKGICLQYVVILILDNYPYYIPPSGPR